MRIIQALASLLKAIGRQFMGRDQSHVWRAYTQSGKIVVIKDNQVIDVIDPARVPKIIAPKTVPHK